MSIITLKWQSQHKCEGPSITNNNTTIYTLAKLYIPLVGQYVGQNPYCREGLYD